MKNKTRLFSSIKTLLLLLILSGLSLAVSYRYTDTVTAKYTNFSENLFSPTKGHEKTTMLLIKKLNRSHYLNEPLDDVFSEKVYNNYIRMLDPARVHFLEADIEEFSIYRHSFDDYLKKGNLLPGFFMYSRYHERRQQRIDYSLEILSEGIDSLDFQKDIYLDLDRENLPWPADINAAKVLWRRLLKNDILNMKLGGTPEEEILSILTKRYKNQSRLLGQTNNDDVFELFISAYTRSYDPHTDYFAPDESENFDINMSLSLEGIGAMLQSEDHYVKVVRLIPGGPAEQGRELQPEDRIIAVGQGDENEMQDVEGWRLDDVVKLIRGPRDTVVRLKIVPADSVDISSTRIISITRDAVKLEEQSAKKDLIKIRRGETLHKVGVIKLPTFYVDFQAAISNDPDYRSSSRDVEKLVLELLEEGIDGLIIDLRNNGGGALQEASEMTGLFIETGPVVQVRNASDQVMLINDMDPKLIYPGPMAVLVNRLSASASEIFAGAVQDYGRGIIVGSQTFGKGTVQNMERLNAGRVKFTEAKYYRINGKSTQKRGVIPDIIFPAVLDHEKIGESSLPQTMAWDQIRPADYNRLAVLDPTIDDLTEKHRQRIAENADFIYLNERIAFLEENRNKTTVSLSESVRRQERESMKQRLLDMENRRRKALELEPYKDYAEMESAEKEEDADSQPDSIIRETGEILTDWLVVNRLLQ